MRVETRDSVSRNRPGGWPARFDWLRAHLADLLVAVIAIIAFLFSVLLISDQLLR